MTRLDRLGRRRMANDSPAVKDDRRSSDPLRPGGLGKSYAICRSCFPPPVSGGDRVTIGYAGHNGSAEIIRDTRLAGSDHLAGPAPVFAGPDHAGKASPREGTPS